MNRVPDRQEDIEDHDGADDGLAMQEISLDDQPPPQPPPPVVGQQAPEAVDTAAEGSTANAAAATVTHGAEAQADLDRAMGGPAPSLATKKAAAELYDDIDLSADETKADVEKGQPDEVLETPLASASERWRLGQAIGLTKIGVVFWGAVLLIPNVFILLVLLIPLGDPDMVFDKHGAWPFIFFVNPLIMALIAYLHLTPYWGAHGDERPFTLFPEKLPIMVAVYVLEVVVILTLVMLFDFFSFIGLVSLGISFVIAFFGTWMWQRLNKNEALLVLFRKYMKIVTLLYIHLIILAIYVILFRELPSSLQSVLTFALSIVVFINRKIMLSFTDPFPLELGMLISGFWINNVSDMFQTLAYPNVKDPITFLYIWLINFVGDAANLIFLTSAWFKFRVWIKAVLQGKCRRMPKPNYEDTDPDERGHSNNRPGYRRRQARFYFWRITSKLVAIAFYLTISVVLRYYDRNNQYYNFSNDPYTVITSSGGKHPNVLSDGDYAHSVVYVLCNFVITMLAGLLGYALIRWHWREVYRQLSPVAHALAHNHTFIGFIAAIVAHNGLMAIVFLQYHQRIWWYDLSFI